MSSGTVELTPQNFNQLLSVDSFAKPILIDFWADWCAPCKALMPVIEKLSLEYSEQMIFTKLDTEAQAEIAAQFGVKNLPTVAIIKDGRPVDFFSGALPESEVRAFIEKNLPKAWEIALKQAEQCIAEAKYAEALPFAAEAFELSQQLPMVAKIYTQVLILNKRISDAELVLAQIPFRDQDEAYKTLLAQIDLANDAANGPEIQQLQQALAEEPDNLDVQFELAVQYHSQGQVREGLELMLAVIKKDKGFKEGEAKKTMLEMIQTLGQGDPLAAEFQRRFFTLLY